MAQVGIPVNKVSPLSAELGQLCEACAEMYTPRLPLVAARGNFKGVVLYAL
jgi:hypothetical protein